MDLLQKSGEPAPDYWSAPGVEVLKVDGDNVTQANPNGTPIPNVQFKVYYLNGTSGGTAPALRWSIGFNSPETDCKCLPWNGKEQKGTRKRQVRNKIFSINSNVSISYEQ